MLKRKIEELHINFLEIVLYNFILNYREKNKFSEYPIKHHIDQWQYELMDIINYHLDD